MIYVTFERTVRRRPEIVWGFLTDLDALSSWVEGLVEVRAVDGKLANGTLLTVERRTLGTGAIERVTCEITAWREPSLLALEARRLFSRFTLASVNEGTRLGIGAELRHGSSFLISGEATPMETAMRGVYERSIDALVTRIERQSAIPYR